MEQTPNKYPYRNARSRKAFFGIFLVLIGSLLLLRRAGFFFPGWILSWPMFFIVIGLFTGVRHNFRNPASYILILLGLVFLLDRMIPGMNLSIFVWPVVLILIGLYMISGRSHRGRCRRRRENYEWDKRQYTETENTGTIEEPISHSEQDFVDATSVFGGVKKNIVSKNFRGGDIVNFFGGAEINLSQADIQGRVVLEVSQIFGGTKIIVPPHWEVHPEMTAIFGGIEDKRPIQADSNSAKVLVIRGTSIFGGIDIRSF
jgi:predicted membrane protein